MLPRLYDRQVSDPFGVKLFEYRTYLSADYEIGFYYIRMILRPILGRGMLLKEIRNMLGEE